MKRFFTFLNILELLSFSFFLLFSLFFLSNFGETATRKVFHHYLGDILWLNFMYGGALELLTIPMLYYISVFSIKIALWGYIMTRGAIGY